MSGPILPGATIGILGGGQLGRMTASAARRLGYGVEVFSPGAGTPGGALADRETNAPYEDLDALAGFAGRVDVVTFEFENVPVAATECAERHAPVRPAGRVLHVCQNRAREKAFLSEQGFPVTPFREVERVDALPAALEALGTPAVLKTAGFGYDGKGQAVIETAAQAEAAWERIGGSSAVLEAMVDFRCELSVVAARGPDGRMAHWGPVVNEHRHHVLDVSVPGVDLPARVRERAEEIARGVLEALDVVGVLCVEFFLTRNDELLVNELAPRPHNSGHFTFDASLTSQFEQQVRAVCGLPLGATDLLRPAAMVNLLGDLWQGGEPHWAAALGDPAVKLHLYGKAEPERGRKMGHLTAFGASVDEARTRALAARDALTARR